MKLIVWQLLASKVLQDWMVTVSLDSAHSTSGNLVMTQVLINHAFVHLGYLPRTDAEEDGTPSVYAHENA